MQNEDLTHPNNTSLCNLCLTVAVPTSGGLDPRGHVGDQVEQLPPWKQIANFISTANGETANFGLSEHAVPKIHGA